MEKGKELNLSDISAIQYGELRHALGLDRNHKRPSRNYYYAYEPSPLWEDLVNKGFAKKLPGQRTGEVYYIVTFEAVKLVYRNNISFEYYYRL
ncbi:hypothetical protein [Cytobacillus pseudoceanisediminis]|uniref:hypothetical protein n=1 Tax=Cytobacillus pseudoceanisediminis TaxID=3051614 RepID=UPI003C2DA623